MTQQLPLVLSLLVCDDIWVDANTGKQSVMGIFGAIAAPSVPYTLKRMAVYASLTECPAQAELQLRIIDANENAAPVVDLQHKAESPDPRAVLQGAFRLNDVAFPEYGEYRVQLFACGELLLERRIHVIRPRHMQEPADAPPLEDPV